MSCWNGCARTPAAGSTTTSPAPLAELTLTYVGLSPPRRTASDGMPRAA